MSQSFSSFTQKIGTSFSDKRRSLTHHFGQQQHTASNGKQPPTQEEEQTSPSKIKKLLSTHANFASNPSSMSLSRDNSNNDIRPPPASLSPSSSPFLSHAFSFKSLFGGRDSNNSNTPSLKPTASLSSIDLALLSIEDDTNPESYDAFVNLLKEPTLSAHASLFSFLNLFRDNSVLQRSMEERANIVQTFLTNIHSQLTPIFHQSCGNGLSLEESSLKLYGHLERYVLVEIYDRVFANETDFEKDIALFDHISKLQQFITPAHLDVCEDWTKNDSWIEAQEELLSMTTKKIPTDKIACIARCCLYIFKGFKLCGITASADQLLPTLIYLIIQTNPPCFHSNLRFISLFSSQTYIPSEFSYYLVSLLTATSFVQTIDAKSLKIDPTVFYKHMNKSQKFDSILKETDFKKPEPEEIRSPLEFGLPDDVFEFVDKDSKDLSSEDVEKLLKNYKKIVTTVFPRSSNKSKPLPPSKTLLTGDFKNGEVRRNLGHNEEKESMVKANGNKFDLKEKEEEKEDTDKVADESNSDDSNEHSVISSGDCDGDSNNSEYIL